MTTIFTARMGVVGANCLDIGPKGEDLEAWAGYILQPTLELVGSFQLKEALKSGLLKDKINRFTVLKEITEAEFTEQYTDLVRAKYQKHYRKFLNLLGRQEVCLTCLCPWEGCNEVGTPHRFCHRYLAVTILEKIAAAHEIPFYRGGEIT